MNSMSSLIGSASPTARALLERIAAEEKAATDANFAANLAQQHAEATQRAEVEAGLRQRAAELLARYEELRQESEAVLMQLARIDRDLPIHSARVFPMHLRHVHLPPATLGRLEPIHPTFTSMDAALQVEKL